jgi:hypothetical protein
MPKSSSCSQVQKESQSLPRSNRNQVKFPFPRTTTDFSLDLPLQLQVKLTQAFKIPFPIFILLSSVLGIHDAENKEERKSFVKCVEKLTLDHHPPKFHGLSSF